MMANPEIDLWATDEVHFQQHGSRCRMWIAPEESDPIVLHEPTRKSVGYFGAVRLRDGKFVYRREADKFNAETFWTFLKQLRKVSCHSGKKVFVISDNARYHHAQLHKDYREDCADRFALCFLPPYSPDLNPIERVWKLTRKCCTHNEYFPTLESIARVVERKFDEWAPGNDSLRKLCAIN
jgi:transposase